MKGRKMLARVSLIGERLKSDEMARHGSMMAAFVFLGGLFSYLYQLVMGRMLSAAEYGTLFSLTSLFMIFMVFSQTIQTSIAKFTSTFKVENRPGRIKYLWKTAFMQTLLFGLALFVILVLLSPLISSFLNIDNNWHCVIVFSSFLLAFAIPANCGVLQGQQRFFSLGVSTLLLSLLRLSLGALLVYLGFGLYGGLLGVPLAVFVVFFVTLFFLRGLARGSNEKVEVGGLFSYAGLTLLAIGCFTILTNMDVVLAKHYLDSENAGNYSSIAVLGRIALIAPMGIAMAMFPKTSVLFQTGRSYRPILLKAMLFTILIAGAVVVVYWLFPDFVVNALFGDKYPMATDHILKYGAAMFLFAISFLLMNLLLSLNKTKVAYCLLGTALFQLGLIVLFHSNIAQLVNIMLISAALCLVFMFPFYLKVSRAELGGGIHDRKE